MTDNCEKKSMNFRIMKSNTGCLFHHLISIFYSGVSQIEVFERNHWIHAQTIKYRYLFRLHPPSERDVTTVIYSGGSGIWAHFSEQRQWAFVILDSSLRYCHWGIPNNLYSADPLRRDNSSTGFLCPSPDPQCVNRKDKRVLPRMTAREKTHEDSGESHMALHWRICRSGV